MNSHAYDPKDVTIMIESDAFGSFAVTCMGEDDIECAPDNDFAEAAVGAQGDVIINKSADRRGTITFPVQGACPQLPTMKKMAKVTDMFSVWVVNKSTNEKTGGTKAFFKKPADNSVGAALNDRSFEVQVLDYTDD